MHVTEHTLDVARPPDEVWPWLIESTRLERWVGGLREFAPLDDGGPRLGARSRQEVELGGRRWELESEITQFDPRRELEVRSEHEGFSLRQHYRLDAHGGGTRLHCRVETGYRGLLGKMVAGLVKRQAQRKLEDDLARLKRLAEDEE